MTIFRKYFYKKLYYTIVHLPMYMVHLTIHMYTGSIVEVAMFM